MADHDINTMTRDEAAALVTDKVIEDALNAAVRVVQDALGVTDGFNASHFFCDTGSQHETFAELMIEYGKSEAPYISDEDRRESMASQHREYS